MATPDILTALQGMEQRLAERIDARAAEFRQAIEDKFERIRRLPPLDRRVKTLERGAAKRA
ncbi:MAG: hypothetical protein NDJ94_11200 [Vicinamibacteria bacterium]|nr:hypothetical protein [Vicinamibacteria bacterium]